MAFNITLQTNTSEEIRMDKVVNDIITLSGTLRDRTSLVDPIIIVETPQENIINCNYLTIPEFQRSYYVRNVTSLRTGIWQLDCHCDVISSFKSQIRQCSGIIYKQENLYDLFMDDGTFKIDQRPKVKIMQFPYGFTTKNFVLAVAGA